MIGAGGTGTHLLPALLTYLRNYHRNQGTEYQLVIADGDFFEDKNQTRQLFDANLTMVNKAEAMLHMYPDQPIIAVSRYVGAADIEQMVQDGDCVLICADNYSVRALVAEHAKTLDNVVVVNGGNELNDGSVQLWVREGGKNLTPAITFGHPEIKFRDDQDRAAMTCQVAAQLPGGEQTILANMGSAFFMLNAVNRWHTGAFRTEGHGPGWTELQFDLTRGQIEHIDMRDRRGWAN